MEPFLSQILLLIALLLSFRPGETRAQEIKSTSLLDLLIRDYTFKSYFKQQYLRTGELHTLNLPKNLSDIRVDVVRYRCGSLRRYGAKIKEFHLGVGVTVEPCVERVLVVRQVLGFNWSSMFYSNYDLSGYQLVTPVLGLLAYNAGSDVNVTGTIPLQLGVLAGDKPITVNFTGTVQSDKIPASTPLCANFLGDRKLTLTDPVAPHVCPATGHGHFGLLTELPPEKRKRESKWKVAVGSSIGSALGFFLLSLLMVALFVKAKKKSRREEMERRAYEEEALQVSMVGHVRAPTASGTRTTPVIEHGYAPFHHS